MFKRLFAEVSQNKNFLMLLTAGIYILGLYSVLSGQILVLSLLFLIVGLVLIIKEILPLKDIVIWNVVFYLGIANTSVRLKNTDELLNLAPVNSEISGTVISIPQGKSEGKPKFFLKVNSLKFGSEYKTFRNEKVFVTLNPEEEADFADLKLYNSLALKGRLSSPFKAGNPSQFDYGNYLKNYGTYAVFYAKNFDVLPSELSLKAKLMQEINDYREKILAVHSKYMKTPNLEILGGIVFGDDAVSPPKDIKQSFVNSGLLHILAASGMNVAFIYGFFFVIMSILKVPFKIRVSLGMVMVLLYSFMTGLGASVVRATCMLLFVLIGKLIDRDANSVSLLSFVALLMLIYNPMYINDVGFQLSFVVTFGLLVTIPAVVRADNKITEFISSTVAIPVIAQLWVIPIQIYYFSNICLYSVFANIMSVPILMAISFGGFISSLISVVTPISDFVCMSFDFILNPLITMLVNISDFWGRLPNSAIQTTHPSVLRMCLYYLLLLSFTAMLYKDIREKYFKRLALASVILSLVWAITLIPVKNTNLEITVFDVGNADSFLIKTPENKYLMIDTGKSGYKGGKSQAEIIMLKYLKDTGIKQLDSLIITHFDNDHCGGAADILKGVKVGRLYVNNVKHESSAAREIYSAAKNAETSVIQAGNNQTVYNNGKLKLVNYFLPDGKNDNENSIITLLSYDSFTMLFTGDAGAESISKFSGSIPKNITVLKAPHHGAYNGLNRELAEYLNPKHTIISTGENKFGHPAPLTLALLRGSDILRTDVYNSVKIIVNPKGYEILSYDIKKKKYVKLSKSSP